VLPFLLWSCTSHPLQEPDPDPVAETAQYREVNPIRNVDILFIVDDSGSMRQEQGNLSRNFPIFMDELAGIQGADLQIAVASTDLGAGTGTPDNQCALAPGDGGVFCRAGGMDLCSSCMIDTSNGRFLRTVNPNFPGDIRSAFTCIASMGTTGCGYEHSLGALRSALTAPENQGFVREDAYLAFVIITDEDDCTAPPDTDFFSMDSPGQSLSLRCSLQAHVCNGQRNTGMEEVDFPFSQCGTAPADGVLVPLSDLVGSVLEVKKDPSLVIAAGIFGWPSNEANARYEISPRGGGNLDLDPVCSSSNGSAIPAFRVRDFVQSFPNNSTYSICQDDFREAMRRIGEKIRATVGPPCIAHPLVDIDPDTSGLQPDCNVVETRPRDGGGSDQVLIPRCPGVDGEPCWELRADGQCTESGHLVEIDRRGGQPVEGTRQAIRCLTCAGDDCD